jgi:predicted permease
MEVDAAASGFEGSDRTRFYGEILERLAALPKMEGAAFTTRFPLGLGNVIRSFEVPGTPPPPDADHHRLELTHVSPDYLAVMGIPLVRGRGFLPSDDAAGAPVVVVSQAAADRFWPGQDPVGRVIHAGGDPETSWTVVGVVGNVRIWSRTEPPRPYLYFPAAQHPAPTSATFVARGSGSAPALARRLAEAARDTDPDAFVVDLRTMESHLAGSLFLPRMAAALIGSLATLALVLASVGLWGIVSYGVSRRTRELGVRMALGAERRRIVGLVMRGGLVSVGVGAVIGLAGAAAVARILDRFLIGIDGWDLPTFASVPVVLVGVALLAAYLPALRATRVDPVEALGSD